MASPKRILWLADSGLEGGAQLSSDALLDSVRAWASVEYLAPFTDPTYLPDLFVVQRCQTYPVETIEWLKHAPVVTCVRDTWRFGSSKWRAWLLRKSRLLLFLSAGHLLDFPWQTHSEGEIQVCPSPIDVQACEEASVRHPLSERDRDVIWLGALHRGKGIGPAIRWAIDNKRQVDFYGAGPLPPMDSEYVKYKGCVPHAQVPELLAQYRTFLFLPDNYEPLGRSVLEAYACGCDMEINDSIGATSWFEAIDRGGYDPATWFWALVKEIAEEETS